MIAPEGMSLSGQLVPQPMRSEERALGENLIQQSHAAQILVTHRLKLGLSTARLVLDAQARASRLRAVVDYNQSLIEWQRLTGE